jgi:predicted NAD-dependent protein-ADP-ribosyltransferase YbiA (DUF1768 family)
MRSTDYRETDGFVFFWQAWPSQWWPSPFSERLAIDGPRLRFGCAEQYVMARKAVLFGDDRAL